MPTDPIITRAFAEYRAACERIHRQCEVVFWAAAALLVLVALAVRP